MNQLKVQLREMNKENRNKAMMELKQSFSKNGQGIQQHQHQQNKQIQEYQMKHQPQYRQLQGGQGRGNRRK